jgi:hypothetical protein
VDQYKTHVLVLECKRALDKEWIFLLPSDAPDNIWQTKTWITTMSGSDLILSNWMDCYIAPGSYESSFCIANSGKKENFMLERIASTLVDSSEAFAISDQGYLKKRQIDFRGYCNVIVTTTDLKILKYKHEDFSLKDGTFKDAAVEPVDYIRFRKQLSTHGGGTINSGHGGYEEIVKSMENTVFVVNSMKLIKFLESFQISPESNREISTITANQVKLRDKS